MNGTFRFFTLIQAAVTVSLLLFAFALRAEAPDVTSVVVGAAVAHWLRESSVLGRSARDDSERDFIHRRDIETRAFESDHGIVSHAETVTRDEGAT